jgi:hypothetical protein
VAAEPVSEVHEAAWQFFCQPRARAKEALARIRQRPEPPPGIIRLTANKLLTTNLCCKPFTIRFFKMHTDAMRMAGIIRRQAFRSKPEQEKKKSVLGLCVGRSETPLRNVFSLNQSSRSSTEKDSKYSFTPTRRTATQYLTG